MTTRKKSTAIRGFSERRYSEEPCIYASGGGKRRHVYSGRGEAPHTEAEYAALYGQPGETPEQRAFRRFPISREPG